MKKLAILLFSFCTACAHAQHHIEKIWESDTTLPVPESVLPDFQKGILYVSLIDGQPWGVDGKGGVGKLDRNGKILNASWITGLNAPKGMGMWKGKLYVADVTEVLTIDIAAGRIENKLKIEGAENLNDITVDGSGVVFVSDSKGGKVYRIANGKATQFLEGLKGVNGLKAVGNELYLVTATELDKADASGKITKVAPLETGGDGLEPVGNGDFLATSWSGYLYYIYANGKKDLMLDTHAKGMKTADIGYDAAQKIIYVPTFFNKSVIAYRLK